jgi:choline dehydrogenase-like flavoprotein
MTLIDMVKSAGGELDFIGSPLGLREMGRGAFPDADPLSRFLFRKWFRKTMCMGAAIHESGGARMGTSPENSVLNGWNQSWDVPNLLVTDASAFAGGGTAGTTLTVMALTLRACRKLAAQYRGSADISEHGEVLG